MSPAPPPLAILHVLLTGGWGGSERYCLDLIGRQQAAGHRTALVLRPRSNEPVQTRDYLPAYGGPRLFTARRPLDPFMVAGAAVLHRADVVHAHLGWSARAAGSPLVRAPAVATLHMRYRSVESRRLTGLIRVAEWQAAEMADYPGQAVTIPNWLPRFDPPAAEAIAQARRLTGAGPDELLLGFVGRFTPVKGADLLLHAFRAVAPAHARLALVGEGPQRPELEALAAGDPRIVFLGHRSDPSPFYRAFDALVMPSRFEPFGLVALEAMAAGLPILASAAEGPREIFAGTPARLTPPDDLPALTEALGAVLAGARPPRLSYDLSRFDGERAAARIESFYRQLIARSVAPVSNRPGAR